VSRFKRIGHRGAGLIAPGNTRESFEAALRHGVDMVEFDVLRTRDGRLVLAHDRRDSRGRPDALSLEAGLDLFAQDAWSGVELNVDIKAGGYEEVVARELAARGLSSRALVSSMDPRSLARVRAADPEVRLGLSVPRVKHNWYAHRATRVPAVAAVYAWRQLLPPRLARALRAGAIDAVMAHWCLVTPRMVAAVRDAGGELYVWTVDEPARIAELSALGVAGIASNDPRLFATA
jgi:glycerophosphoryl diester phosphodiesterase